ncbi:acetate/propionate family kinase [Aristaeella hokkaidonensis]|uniref:Acetate kinase n=1 Tax=Aristaeella hokkaidonensis TaxID=3046382 RepID=A0AC61MXR7_9FIRM|nr:acetate kinase [Aristaeella hokkaidonensis]QUC67782.1 acetate kinase [Aristaeella hokkaidonensis]SNT92836.1 acetate kinase [Aristaeella hokkaidonensis]
MKILVVNAGSSSLKYQLIDMDGEKELAKGLVERIGIEGSKLKHSAGDKKTEIAQEIPDHEAAAQLMLKILQDPEFGVIKSTDEIGAVGHRVLHGGSAFTASVIVNDAAKQAIRDCFPLGPLHNPANLMGIEACEKVMKGTPQVAVFDTAFHQTMPPKAYMYGVPKMYEEKLHVRRYGFHGTSHRYVSRRVCEFLGISPIGKKIIICHLGNGSSLSAVMDGKCQDTSMGLTPLEGLLMGTRCGSCDPAVVQFIANNPLNDDGTPVGHSISVDEVLTMMNKKSGLLGISGKSSDCRDIDDLASKGDPNAKLAQDMLIYGIKKYIGSYAAAMGGVDIIVFTAGIGENNADLRAQVIDGLEFMGAKIDTEKNKTRKEAVISADDSKVTVCVIPTNEEIMIARDTLDLVTTGKVRDN